MTQESKVLQLVAEQAEDDGLWFAAQTASEAYLQQELRRLHAEVESLATPEGSVTDLPGFAEAFAAEPARSAREGAALRAALATPREDRAKLAEVLRLTLRSHVSAALAEKPDAVIATGNALDGLIDRLAASAPKGEPTVTKIDRGFRFDCEKQHHVPTLLLEFEPVPVNSPNDAKGWRDRNALADALAAPAFREEAQGVGEREAFDDLLAACRKAEEWLSGWASAEPYIGVLRAAIARASAPQEPSSIQPALTDDRITLIARHWVPNYHLAFDEADLIAFARAIESELRRNKGAEHG